jgi:hypothetical protein
MTSQNANHASLLNIPGEETTLIGYLKVMLNNYMIPVYINKKYGGMIDIIINTGNIKVKRFITTEPKIKNLVIKKTGKDLLVSDDLIYAFMKVCNNTKNNFSDKDIDKKVSVLIEDYFVKPTDMLVKIFQNEENDIFIAFVYHSNMEMRKKINKNSILAHFSLILLKDYINNIHVQQHVLH